MEYLSSLPRVSDIRGAFISMKAAGDYVTDKTGVKTIEILGATFLADEPAIFGTPNEDWIARELQWYHSKSRNVNDIPGKIPEIWKAVADKDGFINSNYGWCIWSEENHNQYESVLCELQRNPDSRRAEMIYTRPTMHKDFNENGRSDFICTDSVSYFIRSGKLYAHVKMRSNDAIFGFKGDYPFQRYVLEELAGDLGVPPGEIIWTASSLHVYERHFNLIPDPVVSLPEQDEDPTYAYYNPEIADRITETARQKLVNAIGDFENDMMDSFESEGEYLSLLRAGTRKLKAIASE